MREIKFRAWNPESEIMMDSISIQELASVSIQPFMSHKLIWLQYTGLKDKNGKEIYEGDQLYICAGYSSIVAFEDGMFVSVYSHSEDGETLPLYEAICKDTEIIGNIYER